MKNAYEILNGTKDEEQTINNIIKLIEERYSEKICISRLKKIEIVDKLDYGSSGRSLVDKIILSRKNGLDGVYFENEIPVNNIKLRMLISTIYHELWHISTWKDYEDMYGYIVNCEKGDLVIAYAYMYWIEYIAHVETVFMEVPEIMNKFCNNFVSKKWSELEYGYSYFIKELPYYLIRSQYLNIFDDLTKEIRNNELKDTVFIFDKESKHLLHNNKISDREKANVIADLIVKLLEG